MVASCDDESVIGSPFYVMERIEGTILRRDIPPELGLDVDGVRALCENAIDTLVRLHDVDVDVDVDVTASGLGVLDRGDGYVRRQVEGWSGRYRRARTPDVPDLLAVRLQPTHTPGMLTRAEVVQRYCAARSLDVTPQEWLFYDVFGLFRLAGIAQQIYYRYHHGQTSNPAYARFGEFVRILDARCSALLAGQP